MVERDSNVSKDSVTDLSAENFSMQIQLQKYEREVEFLYKLLQEKGYYMSAHEPPILLDSTQSDEEMNQIPPTKELEDNVWTIQNYGAETLKFEQK